jgi:hypothetical protein
MELRSKYEWMHDCFLLIVSFVLKFDVIYIMILFLLAIVSTMCCNGHGPCDQGLNAMQFLKINSYI